jgi:hypothetical protein
LSSAFILGSSLINPASSLARFIPQMWLFPMCAVLLSHSLNRPFFKILGNALLLILFLNNLFIATAYYPYNWSTTRQYRDRFEALALESRRNPLHFYFGHFLSSAQMRFDQFGIHYGLVEKKEDCHDGERILPHSIVLRCK